MYSIADFPFFLNRFDKIFIAAADGEKPASSPGGRRGKA